MDILPSDWLETGSLAEVMSSSISAMEGDTNIFNLAPVNSVIIFLVDGLGYQNLEDFRGHARELYRDTRMKIRTVFPTTTASALTSLTTGLNPGEHGIVGYQARDPLTGLVLNQLNGWGKEMIPHIWQSHPTLFEQYSERTSLVFSEPKHQTSGLTQAILRGAEYVGIKKLEERVKGASVASKKPGSLIYLYVADLDSAAHSHGVGSQKWLAVLEELDSLYAGLKKGLPEGVGVIVTGDHGVINVSKDEQIVVERENVVFSQIEAISGEPRCLQLHVGETLSPTQDRGEALLNLREEIQRIVGQRGNVFTRDEVVNSGIFGNVNTVARSRMGDLFLFGEDNYAFYTDDALAGTGMIGQHGGLHHGETFIPLITAGVWAL